MTVEEKARVYAKKLVVLENKDKFSDEANLRAAEYYAYKSHLAGYAEAMRWRDPEKELPETDEMVLIQVQIRYTDTIVKVFPSIGILSECGLTHKMRLIDTHRSNGLIIGWRPIE